MTSIYAHKPAFQRRLRPLTKLLARNGITANNITVAAMLLSIVTGSLLALFPNHHPLFFLVPIVLLVRMALNAIDGMLAREHDMASPLGAILNELGDVISDIAIYLPFALVSGISPTLIVLFVLLAVISEMTGVIGIQIGGSRRYDGPMGKSDRAFVFGVAGLLIGLEVSLESSFNLALVFLITMLIWTIVNRSKAALLEGTAR